MQEISMKEAVACLVYSSTMKTQVTCPPKHWLTFNEQYVIPEDLTLQRDTLFNFQLCFRIFPYECPRKPKRIGKNRTHQLLVYVNDVNLLTKHMVMCRVLCMMNNGF
jgi:hypothetical protein